MKRILSLLGILAFSFSVYAGIAPVSPSIGKIAVEIKPESVEEMVLKAFSSEFTEDWLSCYTNDVPAFSVAYADYLAQKLPMKELLVSEYDGNQVKALSLVTGDCITIMIKEGRIAALSIEKNPSVNQ